jgi:hypothetical protein
VPATSSGSAAAESADLVDEAPAGAPRRGGRRG